MEILNNESIKEIEKLDVLVSMLRFELEEYFGISYQIYYKELILEERDTTILFIINKMVKYYYDMNKKYDENVENMIDLMKERLQMSAIEIEDTLNNIFNLPLLNVSYKTTHQYLIRYKLDKEEDSEYLLICWDTSKNTQTNINNIVYKLERKILCKYKY